MSRNPKTTFRQRESGRAYQKGYRQTLRRMENIEERHRLGEYSRLMASDRVFSGNKTKRDTARLEKLEREQAAHIDRRLREELRAIRRSPITAAKAVGTGIDRAVHVGRGDRASREYARGVGFEHAVGDFQRSRGMKRVPKQIEAFIGPDGKVYTTKKVKGVEKVVPHEGVNRANADRAAAKLKARSNKAHAAGKHAFFGKPGDKPTKATGSSKTKATGSSKTKATGSSSAGPKKRNNSEIVRKAWITRKKNARRGRGGK